MERASQDPKRNLGDEWSDWDGTSSMDSSAGKRLFLALSGAALVLAALAALGGFYMVAPRLLQWHTSAPLLLLVLLSALGAALTTAMLLLVVSLLLGRPLPAWLRWFLARVLFLTEGRVHKMGTRLSVNKDRLAHSFLRVHNALERCAANAVQPDRLLILLPRCLTKERIRQIKGLCQELGVHVAVVPGGELARKRIQQIRPHAVIGVACERDLLGGVRDVGGKIGVLGIPNKRPNGPCKDTVIDLEDLREALEFYLDKDPAQALAACKSGEERDSSNPTA